MWYYWQRGKHTNKWNSAENPEIDIYKYAQMIFAKGAKAIQWRKENLFESGAGAAGHPKHTHKIWTAT